MSEIIPAILTNNLEDYTQKISALEHIVSRVQVDIIDGEFAPNHTISLEEVATVPTSLFLELHLMVKNPETRLDKIVKTGVKLLVLHFEAIEDKLEALIEKIHSMNIQVGIAINPETPIERIEHILDTIDLVLVMGVHPGFEGQKFIPQTLDKIASLRAHNTDVKIEVDGGINRENIYDVVHAGADYIVMNSTLFANGVDKKSIKIEIESLREKLEK